MTDKHGTPLLVGARVRFYSKARSLPVEGTVRTVRNDGLLARVDDGTPSDPDMGTNGFSLAAWVKSDEVEVLT